MEDHQNIQSNITMLSHNATTGYISWTWIQPAKNTCVFIFTTLRQKPNEETEQM